MRFIVVGAGAVGGVIGARLVQSGADVILVARGAHADAIERNGLRIESPHQDATLQVDLVRDPRRIDFDAADDVVVLAVKSQHTATAIESLSAAMPSVPIVCAQNGVENERVALRSFQNVYGASVMCPTGHLAPGVVEASSSPVTGIIDVGRYPSGSDAVTEAVAAALRAATFESMERDDIMRWKYGKLLMNLTNAVEAACGASARRGPLADLVRSEGEQVLRAAGIEFEADGTEHSRREAFITVHPIGGRRRAGSSTWQSLARGTGNIETDFLNGEIALLGRLHDVPTPANALMQQLAGELSRTGGAPGTIPVDAVLERLGATA